MSQTAQVSSVKHALDDVLEFHWMMDMLQTVDVGIVVLDREYKIHMLKSHRCQRPVVVYC